MRVILPILFMFALNSVRAQAGFEKLYGEAGGSSNCVELNSGNLLSGLTGGAGGTGMSLLDPEGNILQTSSFVQFPFLAPIAYKRIDTGTIRFVSGYFNWTSCNGMSQIFPVIGKMDTAGNVLMLNHYELNEACNALAVDLEVTEDEGVVTWGWRFDFYALRVDSDLTPVWSKHFNRHGHFQFIKELPGGDLLAGFNMDTAGASIARMSANGDFIWCRSYMRPTGSVNACLIESDSSFTVIGLTDVHASSNQKLYMMNLNAYGDVQWCRGYAFANHWDATYPIRLIRSNDQNYALIAVSGGGRPVLMKTNLNGDTLWTRAYGVPGYGYETGDLLTAENGGFLFSGIVNGNLPDMNLGLSYLFRTDSLGYLPCTPVLQLPIVINELFPSDSSFTLTSVDGALGIPGAVNDTVFGAVTVYNGCVITSTPRYQNEHRFQVYPNPNSGRFTVEFNDPLMAESYYSVYDAMGRLLYQRPLPTGKQTEQIDLSRFGKGSYVIKFTDKEGTCYERVVVE